MKSNQRTTERTPEERAALAGADELGKLVADVQRRAHLGTLEARAETRAAARALLAELRDDIDNMRARLVRRAA